ncbi:hypothetical protein AWM68_17860 [Fictibacillus phosphorivorans]|uniref:Replication-relaxation n=1 Tax=Fictibacillus phosphorivorans TaxID=1221500 RepID=A0A161RUT8_9BACL|nr:hypothetical protein [Fictibacillus phosphorivorans]KZE68036.1 hypothetical protein AWM68_17860 [Fictibacillus phosphorivorans]
MEVLTQAQSPSLDGLEESHFTTKQGEVPFWDHPFLKGSKMLPQKYYPYTTLEGVLDLYRRRRLDESDFILLKVLGDAVCANEDQLRRYMAGIMNRSETSKRLDRYRTSGLVERWKVRIRGQEETYKPPAPFTLGVAGYKLLKHFYSDNFFMNADRWDSHGIGGIKRYVAMNELRCQMIEQKMITKWKWNAIIADNRSIKFPMGVAEVKTPQGKVNFLIDRAQMNQNFIGYFREKLDTWKWVYEKYGSIPVSEFADNMSFVVIFTSTLSVAEKIHKELMLDTYPFTTWFCVEEDLVQDGLNNAFYVPNKEKLKRIKVNF